MNSILLLHGALGSASQLTPLKTALEKNRLTLSVNFSGHSGESFSPSGFGIEVFADDIHTFLKARNTTMVDIFGYSMGGYVALWYALKFPERVGKVITLGTKFDWSRTSAGKEVQKLDPEKIEKKVPAFARILQHRHAPNDWKVVLQKTAAMMLGLGDTPLLTEDVLSTIKNKVIIALGNEDDMADRAYSEKISEILPHGEFVSLQDTPHPIEKVDVNKIVRLILQES